MGGILSGNPNCKTHGTTSHCMKIDSFLLGKYIPEIKKDVLKLDCSWSNGSGIAVFLHADKVTLHYMLKDTGEKIIQDYQLVWKDGNLGGKFVYFLCPTCCKNVRFLYFVGKHFKCRSCANLNYPSQQTTKGNDYDILRLRKAALKLDKDALDKSPMELSSYMPQKPKGMHWTTYSKHLKAFRKAQYDYNNGWILAVSKILKR